MSSRLREDSLLERSSFLIERCGSMAKGYRRRLVRRLLRARLPEVTAALTEVQMGGWFAPPRALVLVRHRRHPDVHCYVGAEAAGVHLEVTRYVALEPALLKRLLAGWLTRGAWWRWSLPGKVTGEESLGTFLALVDACMNDVTKDCLARAQVAGDALAGGSGPVDGWQ